VSHRGKLVLLPENRVWRSYPGGRTLDRLAGHVPAADGHFAEDWIASATRAVNPPDAARDPAAVRFPAADGVSRVLVGGDPEPRDFAALLASDPDYFLGPAAGAAPRLLVKFLDSGTRLHFQVHPTRQFARERLGAPAGKTEAYHVLAVRDDAVESDAGSILVGFQRPPSRAQLRDWIRDQDIAAIRGCFDPVRVAPGDTFLIPGGTPHALGAGIFMVEIQEPSDLVVRFEFERGGFVLPEPARFMGRGLDVALDVFDLEPLDAAALEARVRCRPRAAVALGAAGRREELIGPDRTDCFRVFRTRLAGPVEQAEAAPVIAIVTAGAVRAHVGGETHRLGTFAKAFLPAGLGPVRLEPEGDEATILECLPPA
jgi:mannose-6-phosphate isomerase